ncbi:hypothetical protein M408DRAFT_328111, partial [Serendipita vermifera MAFF 305830]
MAAARLAVLRALWKPINVIPRLTVKDIRDIDFISLRKQGFDSIVFDKDNCLTLPHKDTIIPALHSSLQLCKATFTPDRVLIVSNSSGTPSEDPGYIEAESVQRQLGCRVLRHNHKKPSRRCAKEIVDYFTGLDDIEKHPSRVNPGVSSPLSSEVQQQRQPKIILVGDRIMTDILLANEMGAYGIYTTRLWEREALFLRFIERSYLFLVTRWLAFREKRREKKLPSIDRGPTEVGASTNRAWP